MAQARAKLEESKAAAAQSNMTDDQLGFTEKSANDGNNDAGSGANGETAFGEDAEDDVSDGPEYEIDEMVSGLPFRPGRLQAGWLTSWLAGCEQF